MFKRILVPVDLSSLEPAARSCKQAREILDSWGCEVHLVNVIPGYTMPLVASFFPESQIKKLEQSVLADLTRLAGEHFETMPEVSVRTGKRSPEIIQLANEWNADLIIFGCRRKDSQGGQMLLGSCSMTVADRAKCSVLIAR